MSTRRTILAATFSVLAWLALFLLAIQIAYASHLDWLLKRDFEMLLLALTAHGITSLVIFWKSTASHQEKLAIAAVSVVAMYGAAIMGGLTVACANGNCL